MGSKAALARLRKEVKNFEAPPYIKAAPLEHNLLEWRFVLQGPPDTIYEGGMYQGRLRFPDDFPFKPPSIFMITPSGRFETDRRLCLSISDFHPESWVPTWSVGTIINGVLSFMVTSENTTGAVVTSDAEKRRLRDASVAFNAKDPVFCELFPDLVDGKPFTLSPHVTPSPSQPQRDDPTSQPTPPTRSEKPDTAAHEEPPPAAAEEAAPGTGKNAAKNKKKREKEKAKRAAAAGGAGAAPAEDGATIGSASPAAAANAADADAAVEVE